MPGFAGLVLLLVAALAFGRVAQLGMRWRHGRAAGTAFVRGLADLPKRYLGDVHAVVAREPRTAFMHAALAGGFLAALALSFILEVLGIASAWAATVLLAALLAMAAGLALLLARRLPARPARLSGGLFLLLPIAFALSIVFFAVSASPLAFRGAMPESVTLMGCAAGLFGLGGLAWMIGGPMRHAVAGTVHLIVHPRPNRFRGRIDADLRPLDLEAARLGAAVINDFSWNRLAGFDACVQCGRCEAACPAFAAGMPLNPKKLINDLANAMSPAGSPIRYAGSPHPGIAPARFSSGPAAQLVRHGDDEAASFLGPETLWACTTCRACVYECPMMIEHVDAIVELRRFETLERGATPGKGAEALDNLRQTDTVGGHDVRDRLDWAVDLGVPLLREGASTDYLLWVGEGAFDRRNQRSLRALVQLLRLAGVDFASLGAGERDTGDVARRLGDEATFQKLARENVAFLSRFSFKRIITLDPHVLHALGNEYSAFGGAWEVRHHSQVLAELLREGRIRLSGPAADAVTYHDPCYLARYNGEIDAPREVIRRTGADLREMQRSGLRATCCGGGGGAPLTDIAGKRRIPDMRMDHVRATGASRVVVACPFCAQMLEGVAEPRPEVIDLAEFLLESVGAAG
jgi:Fe-S oxidoreductase